MGAGLNVLKKNGTTEEWNFDKVLAAIGKSARRVDATLSVDEVKQIKRRLNRRIKGKENISVLEVHNIVEAVLKDVTPRIGKSYSDYRNYKKGVVDSFEQLFQQTKDTLYLGDRENANFNSALSSTKGSLIRGYLTKDLFQKFYLSKNELQATKDGYIYLHDLRDLLLGNFNCCLFDIDTVLTGGFEMSGLKYKEPKSVLSAAQVIGDVTLVATAQIFGGFTLPECDKVLVKYCEKSYEQYLTEAQKYDIPDAEKYAEEKTIGEMKQGIQSLEMKLNSVPSSRGDTAFVTITFGNVDGSVNEKWQRLICHTILETRMNGQGNGSPVVFPKLVYLHSEKQHENVEQQRLFDKAIKCSSQAMYPDFLSLDNSEVGEIYKQSGKVVSPMGKQIYCPCKTSLKRETL